MTGKPFRFAVLATPQDHDQWLATARRAEELGYSGLLMPDGTQLLSPLPALAVAAGATTSLRVGTWCTSFVCVNGAFGEQLAPVVDLLSGR